MGTQQDFADVFETKVQGWMARIEALAIEMTDDRTPQGLMYCVDVNHFVEAFTAVVTSMREAHKRNAENPQAWFRPGPRED